MRFRAILFVLLAAIGAPLAAQTSARELKITFSQYSPPYVFEDGSGILVDIVREALQSTGYTVTPVYVPFGRGYAMFADRKVDGTTIIQESSGVTANYSAVFMQYHNRAFALKSRNLAIRTVADLTGRPIAAFQNASRYLGEEYAQAVAGNPDHRELAQQDAQVAMMALGRVDLAVMDESIFRYYWNKLRSEGKFDKELEYVAFDIFPPTPYKAGFVDPKVRDDFDRSIAAMRKDGRYDAIYRKYSEQYFDVQQ